jgi:hypothetical protein
MGSQPDGMAENASMVANHMMVICGTLKLCLLLYIDFREICIIEYLDIMTAVVTPAGGYQI